MHRYRRLIPYVLRQWPFLVVILLLTVASSATVALQPWPMKLLVDYALGDSGVPAAFASALERIALNPTPTVLVFAAAIASLLLFAINSALSMGSSLAWAAGGQRMVYDLAADLFARLQRLSLLFHSRRSVGDSLSRLTEDTYCIYSVTSGLLMSPLQQTLTLAAIGTVAFKLDPVLATISLTMAPLLAASSIAFGRPLKRRARLGREAKSRLMSFVHQTLGAIPIVQAFGTEDSNREQFQRLADDSVALTQRGNLVNSTFGLVNGLITTTGTAIVLFAGGTRVLSGAITLGSLLVFLAYVKSMQGASRSLFQTFAKLKAAEASIDRVLEILESPDEVRDAPHAKALPMRPRGEQGHVRFEGVTFGYEPGRPVLNGVTLEARLGETVALVGLSGAGKSTLVSMIPRFFDPGQGRITFDGVDLRRIRLASLRAQISLVPQDPFLLPLTVAENIAYGRPGASKDEILAAAVAAQADEFIRGLPDGYDTVMGERGATLSGGQRQRLAIARALLKDAPVLILDEPTSALDAETEAQLLEAFDRLMEGRTTFIIAHRLSTVRKADRIVVLEEGRVVEVGSHRALLDARGTYHRLHSMQFREQAHVGVA